MKVIIKNKVILTGTFIIFLSLAVLASVTLVKVEAMSGDCTAKYKYYTTYEVQPNDTLYDIAEKYTADTNVSVEDYILELKKNNRLKSDKIISGTKIIISYYSEEYK